MIRLLAACLLALLAFRPEAARADDNRPLTISIVEEPAEAFTVMWKVPANVEARHLPALQPPAQCSAGRSPRQWSDPLGHWREEQWACPGGLAGSAIAITYPSANPNLATIARLRMLGATEEQTLLFQPQETSLAIPLEEEAHGTFADFLRLGFEHIWLGIDHLLFVAGLVFVAGTFRRILATITGFTIAHSITLALSALDLVRLPISAVEGVIALSIVFLAVEIVKGPRDTLTWRHPTAIAASFGLLHGFGFASVLREIGLPEEGLLTALLAFNLGIELGQILFAAALAAVFTLLRHAGRAMRAPELGARFGGYGVGILASFWMFERLLP